jgi:hypothetical protein
LFERPFGYAFEVDRSSRRTLPYVYAATTTTFAG